MKGIRIRPEKSGIKASLFDLEAEIMEVVWDNNWDEFSVADVHKVLEERRSIAYTTVMTTVTRLQDKELLTRRKSGRRYMYKSKMTRDGFIETLTREVLQSLPPVGHETAVAILVDHIAQADISELDRLEALIKSKKESLASQHD